MATPTDVAATWARIVSVPWPCSVMLDSTVSLPLGSSRMVVPSWDEMRAPPVPYVCGPGTVRSRNTQSPRPAEAFFARPAHPYTRRLLASVPGPGGELRDIPGDVPSLVGPPPGCRFHPRCEDATPECRRERPALSALAPGHDVRCYHPVEGPIGA
jgi:oligopeptide/dipeptide ABC transporter ATP-binding protein